MKTIKNSRNAEINVYQSVLKTLFMDGPGGFCSKESKYYVYNIIFVVFSSAATLQKSKQVFGNTKDKYGEEFLEFFEIF